MTLHVYNGLTKEKEVFKPIDADGQTVKMYVCGQTVYDYMHIGHARTYVAFDIIKRYLEFRGYNVKTVINLTDVNDKINDRAVEEDRDPWSVAEEYATINLEDFQTLGIHADAFPKASEYVQDMIDLVQTLEEKGFAYAVKGDVFFDVHTFEDYGKLSHQNLEDIRPEREDDIIATEKKRNPEDFVLWKARTGDAATPTWDSPWGEGVPGWHIECSAMSMRLLGEQFDIHGGGSDLVFPHHEDEIAQSEAATGHDWVKYWMHSGLVRLKDEKMSKSLGNFIPTRELLKQHDPKAIRLMIAGTHYRKPLDYSEQKIADAETNIDQLQNTVQTVQAELRDITTVPDRYTDQDIAVLDALFSAQNRFVEAMDDDFNTPEALKHLHKVEETLNRYVNEAETLKRPVLERGLSTLHEMGQVFGILTDVNTETTSIEGVLDAVMAVREALREKEEYALADSIRDALEESGVQIEDTGRGSRWKRA